MKYDIELSVAIGKDRKDKRYKNKKILWSDFLDEYIKHTTRTNETYKEYMDAKKDTQDRIKDVGGYVMGYLQGGQRLKRNVLHRSALTLDIDFGKTNFWKTYNLMFDNAAALYSTHKHTEASPRYRLLIPLSREVFPDEYEAVSRKVAEMLDIEIFDDTTYQPERLMYFPSTSVDADYVFKRNDGPILDPDSILELYEDWKDVSSWAYSSRREPKIRRAQKAQGEPTEKPGLIGAFCKKYSITDVIATFLSDVYEPTDLEDRYTYIEGTTTGGLIVYDDKFAYSHHGSDPASMELCNAFDLVRIHKFIEQDDNADPDTPINKKPSYLSMCDFVTNIPEVVEQIAEDRLQKARERFGPITEAIEDDENTDTSWRKLMDVDKKGNFINSIQNISQILLNDPLFKDNIAYDDFEHRLICTRKLPWRKESLTMHNRFLTKFDDSNILHYIEITYKFVATKDKYQSAVGVLCEKTKFHPVRDYLNKLKWDKKPRLDTLLIDYMGCDDTPYIRAISRKTLVAAITRVFEPGCKMDYMLSLLGPQGRKKSMLIRKLGVNWGSDSFHTVQGKEAYEQLQGVWVIEVAEMAALNRAEQNAVKHFISKEVDRFRVAYGDRTDNFPRQCIFIASSNEDEPNKDQTGGRRYWFAQTGEPSKDVAADLTKYEVDQLYAEAMTFYMLGETLYLNPELEAYATKIQERHTLQDARRDAVEKYLEKPLPEDWETMNIYKRQNYFNANTDELEGIYERETVTASEIWTECFGGQLRDLTANNTKFIHDIMRKLKKWTFAGKIRTNRYGIVRGYKRIDT